MSVPIKKDMRSYSSDPSTHYYTDDDGNEHRKSFVNEDGSPVDWVHADGSGRVDQKIMYRGWEFPVHMDLNGEQVQAVSAPVSNEPATGRNPLFWDFFYRERDPENTVKGAVDSGVEVDTASGPKYTLMPYLKRTSEGSVRYNVGEMAGGDPSGLVRCFPNNSERGLFTVIASPGRDGEASSGEVSYLEFMPDNEVMANVWLYSGTQETGTERVDLPFHHIPSDHA